MPVSNLVSRHILDEAGNLVFVGVAYCTWSVAKLSNCVQAAIGESTYWLGRDSTCVDCQTNVVLDCKTNMKRIHFMFMFFDALAISSF